jgi:hypothetical protein
MASASKTIEGWTTTASSIGASRAGVEWTDVEEAELRRLWERFDERLFTCGGGGMAEEGKVVEGWADVGVGPMKLIEGATGNSEEQGLSVVGVWSRSTLLKSVEIWKSAGSGANGADTGGRESASGAEEVASVSFGGFDKMTASST